MDNGEKYIIDHFDDDCVNHHFPIGTAIHLTDDSEIYIKRMFIGRRLSPRKHFWSSLKWDDPFIAIEIIPVDGVPYHNPVTWDELCEQGKDDLSILAFSHKVHDDLVKEHESYEKRVSGFYKAFENLEKRYNIKAEIKYIEDGDLNRLKAGDASSK